jgi:hypothetical protein
MHCIAAGQMKIYMPDSIMLKCDAMYDTKNKVGTLEIGKGNRSWQLDHHLSSVCVTYSPTIASS